MEAWRSELHGSTLHGSLHIPMGRLAGCWAVGMSIYIYSDNARKPSQADKTLDALLPRSGSPVKASGQNATSPRQVRLVSRLAVVLFIIAYLKFFETYAPVLLEIITEVSK